MIFTIKDLQQWTADARRRSRTPNLVYFGSRLVNDPVRSLPLRRVLPVELLSPNAKRRRKAQKKYRDLMEVARQHLAILGREGASLYLNSIEQLRTTHLRFR